MTVWMAMWMLSQDAHAGSCDAQLAAAGKATGAALVDAYKALYKCDAALAKAEYLRFMTATGDLATLQQLSLAAIDIGAGSAVGPAIAKVPYEHRVPLAESLGDACGAHPKVIEFIADAWTNLRGSEFTPWQPVIARCATPEMLGFLETAVAAPPTGSFSEKYGAVLTQYAAAKGVDALPALEKAALKAADGGPFASVLETMARCIQPKGFGSVAPEARQAMEESLVRIAKAVPAEQARMVVDRLTNAGSEGVAATLLPAVFPDRVQAGGGMLWAAASVEACDGQAVVHWTQWTEAPRRWSVLEAATGALRGQGAKLKCDAGEWPVMALDEPAKDAAAVDAWVAEIVASQTAKGNKAKAKEEKVAVP